MSTLSVSRQIKNAMKNDRFISELEAKGIVAEAEKGPVTVGEARAVADLFDRATPTRPPPGMMVTMAIPENPGEVLMEGGARSALEAFFEKNKIPAGAQKAVMLERIDAGMSKAGYGDMLDKEPDTKKLFMVRLPYPEGAMDFPTRNAFVDLKKGEFFLQVSSMFVPPGVPQTRWYGPTKLGDALPEGLRAKLEDNARSIVSQDAGFMLSRSDAVLVDSIKPNDRGTFDVIFNVAHFLNKTVRASLPIEVNAEGNFVAAG
jgi:hypothetical protein